MRGKKIKPLKSEAIHETGLSGYVVASFFPSHNIYIDIYIYIYRYIFFLEGEGGGERRKKIKKVFHMGHL